MGKYIVNNMLMDNRARATRHTQDVCFSLAVYTKRGAPRNMMDRDMMCVRDVQGIFLVFPHNVVRDDRFFFWYGRLYSWMRWLRFIGEYIDLGMQLCLDGRECSYLRAANVNWNCYGMQNWWRLVSLSILKVHWINGGKCLVLFILVKIAV